MEKHADYFLRDNCRFYFPFFSNIRGFIQNKDLPNIHIVTYEEMKEDISLVIDKIVDFLELPRLDTDHKQKLMEYISINQMRNNSAVNRKNYTGTGDFLNKGIVGNWKTMLTDETIKGFELWKTWIYRLTKKHPSLPMKNYDQMTCNKNIFNAIFE
uniref:Sulfotransferase 1C2like [Musca domestica] n=2 Tax=Lepeophtheirus salmonis TaxID=72036 RepID=A0A0K2TBY4_LEPSM